MATVKKLYFTTDTVVPVAVTYERLIDTETGNAGTHSDSIVTIGSRASTKVGIRVWVYHDDGTQTEVTNGTPVAQVTFTSAEGKVTHSNTWNCPETAILATDRIAVTVFWDVVGGGWSAIPSASYVTDVLGVTILNAATWTVQYEGNFTSTPTFPIGRYLNQITFYYDGANDSYINNFTYGISPPEEEFRFAIQVRKKLGKAGIEDPKNVFGIYQIRTRSGKQVQVKEKFYTPTNPQTEAQQAWRGIFADAVAAWQLLTDQQKAVYNKRVKYKPLSGYNLFLKGYLLSH